MTTPPISTELKAYLSCIYFEALFFDPSSFSIHSFALQGDIGIYSNEIYPLVIEIMNKHPEWIDHKILINSSYVKINGRICDYCKKKNLNEKISTLLEKHNFVDWNYFVMNTDTFTTLSIKVDMDNKYLLMLMLNQLNKIETNLLD